MITKKHYQGYQHTSTHCGSFIWRVKLFNFYVVDANILCISFSDYYILLKHID